MTKTLLTAAALTVAALPAIAGSISIPPTGGFGGFTSGDGGDVFDIDAGFFGVTAPLVFQNDTFGDAGQSNVGADDPKAIGSDVNVVVIQNRDNNDPDGFPSNWDASWNARTALEAISANTMGDRAGFFLYWNEGLGVNRLFATDNLNDPNGSLTRLFTIQSSNLTGVPGDFDLNLSDGVAQTSFFGEANSNLLDLPHFTAQNFYFADQAAPVPLPAALPLMFAALGGLGWLKRPRRA
ncbi:MAG: VPLPA-CTERM sorting domain-containing protein [Pseudomonadota bacterium]